MEFQMTEKTIKTVAETIIQELSNKRSNDQATVVGLSGNLGAGKTTFTKSCAEVLGISPDQITSPTFVIAKFYDLEGGGEGRPEGPAQIYPWKRFIHIDAYRLEKGEELAKLSFNDYVADPSNLIFIEWPENVSSVLPEDIEILKFEVVNENTRNISLEESCF